MGRGRCGGRCAVFLGAALGLDAAGLALVLAGGVGKPSLGGCSLEDFLVLSGALLLFVSLLCWLLWHSGNLRGVPAEELPVGARPGPPAPRGRPSLRRLAAKLAERLSQRRHFAPAAAARLPEPVALALRSWSPLQPPGTAVTPLQAAPPERLV